jgi:hypothetical protein
MFAVFLVSWTHVRLSLSVRRILGKLDSCETLPLVRRILGKLDSCETVPLMRCILSKLDSCETVPLLSV